jgi:hypothetical protein
MRNLLSSPGSSVKYTLSEKINSLSTNVTISNAWQPIATDNFESGGWSGGTGWLDSWSRSTNAAVVNTGGPLNSWHLRLTGNSGVVTRSVNLNQQIQIHLVVWVKYSGWQSSDTASLRVSSDNITWYTAYTWRDGQDDGVYRSYDIDLSSYQMTSRFFISLRSSINNGNIYFDNLSVIWEAPYPTTIASENFESGNWAGGIGWTDNWTHSGYASVTTSGMPHGGLYHLMLQSSTGDARRSVDLSASGIIVHLRFWAKVLLNGSDWAECRISPDGIDWTQQVKYWNKSSPYNTYTFYDVDLSPYQMTSRFWIRFTIHANQTSDYFYVDDITVVNLDYYTITASAGGRVIKAVVQINDTSVIVRYWYFV